MCKPEDRHSLLYHNGNSGTPHNAVMYYPSVLRNNFKESSLDYNSGQPALL